MDDFIIHPNMPDYITVKEAAEMLKLSPNRIRDIVSDGRLPAVWAGNSLMIKIEDLKKFKRMGSGRKRKKLQIWRLSDNQNTQHITSITVQAHFGQKEALTQKLEMIKRDGEHLFPGTVARYFSQSDQDANRIEVILVWRGPIMPDEATRAKELAAFRESFLGVLDWSTAHYQSYHVLMHT